MKLCYNCIDITECEVNICDDSMDCKDMQVPYNCFCKQITGHNNASYCININSGRLRHKVSGYIGMHSCSSPSIDIVYP